MIKEVYAREVLDSRGNPTVEVDVETGLSIFRASVPSGASTGVHEALELRDGGRRYEGKGVLKAVKNVNEIIGPALRGMDEKKQKKIDMKMIELDGTENKSKLGANAILAVSMAVCKAGAFATEIPLYAHISELGASSQFVMPVPHVLVIEGGKHADGGADLQEFMVMPVRAKSFKEAIQRGAEVYQAVGKVLRDKGYNTNVGYEGAYGPLLGSNEKVFEIIVEGIKKAGFKPGRDVLISTDAAASEFFKDERYNLSAEKKTINRMGMIEFYESLVKKYPIASIEDGLSQDDFDGWKMLMEKLGDKIQIMGDDLTVTKPLRIQKAIHKKAINSVLIKVNQIGTVTETIDAVNLAKSSKMTCVVSHRSAETCETFIADLAVGLGVGQCKFGATARGERTAKYNHLLRIEEELGNECFYAGEKYRNLK